jgi:YD repeat-containing protein
MRRPAMRFVTAIALALGIVTAPAVAGTKKYTYDAAGRLLRVDYGNGKGFNYRYDANGNLLSRSPLSAGEPERRRPVRRGAAKQDKQKETKPAAGPAAS